MLHLKLWVTNNQAMQVLAYTSSESAPMGLLHHSVRGNGPVGATGSGPTRGRTISASRWSISSGRTTTGRGGVGGFPTGGSCCRRVGTRTAVAASRPSSRPPSRLLGDGVPVDDDALQPLVEDLQLGDNRVGNLEPLRLVRGRCGDGLVPSCPSTRRFAWERILQLYINVDYMMNMCFNMHIGLISSSRVG